MRRRHLLALVILALVVATVMAFGPVRVWDWMTLRTVEEIDDWGKNAYQVRVWNLSVEEPSSHAVGTYRAWYPNGQLYLECSGDPRDPQDGFRKRWSGDGRLVEYISWRGGMIFVGVGSSGTYHVGVWPGKDDGFHIVDQSRYVRGTVVETRDSPPWFTEEEILQAVEGVEE